MEKRINIRVETYVTEFKNNIRDKAQTLGMSNENTNRLLEYIYDYDRLCFSKEDFIKRKRTKNVVPYFDRCSAKRANGEQCTRRKKSSDLYCGTHLKGTPNGIFDNENNEPPKLTQKVEVWAQDIQGILYYIDKNNNVYKTDDIIGNKNNPSVIAKYVQNGDVYSIPLFGI